MSPRQLAPCKIVVKLAGSAAFEFRDARIQREVLERPAHALCVAGVGTFAVNVGVGTFLVITGRVAEVS